MYLVSGFNLFGQWLLNNPILTSFIEVDWASLHTDKTKPQQDPELIHVNWFYNIYRTNKSVFISGGWCREKQCTELMFPFLLEKPVNLSNFSFSGNDSYILLLDKLNKKLWKLKIKDNEKLHWTLVLPFFNVEKSLGEEKRKKIDSNIIKIIVSETMNLCLTSEGSVFNIPLKVNTDMCIGCIVDLASGHEHAIILTDKGRVYTWGNGRRCQLGHGDLGNLEDPKEVEALAGINIVKVTAGGWHSLALSDSGDVYAWGWNDTGQLGVNEHIAQENSSDVALLSMDSVKSELKSYPVPTLIDLYDVNNPVELNVLDISCGSRHSAIVLEDFSVWTTGFNKYGQLGFDPEKTPMVKSFQKVYQCPSKCSVTCGPWSTVLNVS